MMTENSNKRLIVLCDLGVGGERGRVMSRGGYFNGYDRNGV